MIHFCCQVLPYKFLVHYVLIIIFTVVQLAQDWVYLILDDTKSRAQQSTEDFASSFANRLIELIIVTPTRVSEREFKFREPQRALCVRSWVCQILGILGTQ